MTVLQHHNIVEEKFGNINAVQNYLFYQVR